MSDIRIGSLCSGYGGLDMAVMDVLGGSMAWHCQYDPEDKYQYAARILEHHWPAVPNHGDITQVDWAAVEPVDILTAGFPCQDLSYAGRGAGIQGDSVIPAGQMACGCQWGDHSLRTCDAASPSGLVPSRLGADEAAQAVAELNRLDHANPAGPPPERILKGTRSGLWYSVADAIRALRPRLIVLENVRAIVNRRPGLDVVLASLADLGLDAEWLCLAASDVGASHERERWFCLAWPATDAASDGRHQGRSQPARLFRRPDAALGGHATTADPAGVGYERDRTAWERGAGPEDGDLNSADADGGDIGPEAGLATPCGDDADGRLLEWGQYAAAVTRWERVFGQPAPSPVNDRGRLSPWFVEWMMGLPEGHVCNVPAPPGMTPAGLRNARLKALGNGVVRQQAAYALLLLLDRKGQEVAA